jgi:hypothetical protein
VVAQVSANAVVMQRKNLGQPFTFGSAVAIN